MKRIIYQAVGISFVALFILSGCGSQATSTPTSVPSSTPTPIPLPSETPVPTVKPVSVLLPEAKALCDSALDAPWTGGLVQTPGFAVIKTVYQETSDWKLLNLTGLTTNADEAQGLFCVVQDRVKQPQTLYTDGEDAYVVTWSITALSWPDGKVLGRIGLPGGDPPETKTYAGPGYGDPPQDDFKLVVATAQAGTPTVFTGSNCAAISVDGKRMLTARSQALNTTISLWDMATHQILWAREEKESGIQCDAYISADAKYGFVHLSTSALLLDLESQDEITRVEGIGIQAQFAPDGETLILAGISKNHVVSTLDPQVADTKTGKVIASFPKTHESGINKLSISADGSLLVSSSGDGKITVWDVQARKAKTKIDTKIPFLGKAMLSSDGSLVADSNMVWDAASGEVVTTSPSGLSNPSAFVPGEHSLLYYDNENDALVLWNIESGETKTLFKGIPAFGLLAFDLHNGYIYLRNSYGLLLQMPFSP